MLVFWLWKKHYPQTEEKAFEKLNEIVFELLSTKRFAAAAAISQSSLEIKSTTCSQSCRGMLTVNLAIAQKHMKQNEAAIKTLNSMDWSASSDKFRICIASVKEDMEEVKRLIGRVASTGAMGEEQLRTWPAFSFIRDKAEFSKDISRYVWGSFGLCLE